MANGHTYRLTGCMQDAIHDEQNLQVIFWTTHRDSRLKRLRDSSPAAQPGEGKATTWSQPITLISIPLETEAQFFSTPTPSTSKKDGRKAKSMSS